MKKLFYLYFILLLGCGSEEPTKDCAMAIRISPGIPIQFFVNGQQTYNEYILSQDAGMRKYCFNQEFRCTDRIKLQFTDTNPDAEYDLEMLDEDGAIITTIPFTRSYRYTQTTALQFSNNEFEFSLSDWIQYNNLGRPFAWTADGASAFPGGGTLSYTTKLYQNRVVAGLNGFDKFPPGTYVITVRAKNQSSGGSSPLTEQVYIEAFNDPAIFGEQPALGSQSIARDNTWTVLTFEITTTQEWSYFGVGANKTGSSTGSQITMSFDYVKISEYPKDFTESVFDLEFVPENIDLCDQKVKLSIVGYDNAEIARTDFVQFSSVVARSNVMEYKSIKYFDGIVYPNDGSYFVLRVFSRFFHEESPTQSKAIPLSTGKIINTATERKKRKKLQLMDMPYYMHDKIRSAIEHGVTGSFVINGVEWVVDPYEYNYDEETPETYPLRRAEIFLTKKDEVTRNQT